jgi:hypothetical protein
VPARFGRVSVDSGLPGLPGLPGRLRAARPGPAHEGDRLACRRQLLEVGGKLAQRNGLGARCARLPELLGLADIDQEQPAPGRSGHGGGGFEVDVRSAHAGKERSVHLGLVSDYRAAQLLPPVSSSGSKGWVPELTAMISS